MKNILIIFFVILFSLQWSCKKDDSPIEETNHPPSAPSSPTPENNIANVTTSLTISWSCSDPENDLLTYDIYFGKYSPPTTIVSTGQSETNIHRSGLSNSTTYYWKVVAKDNHSNSTTGAVWSFTTTSQSISSCVGTPSIVYGSKTYHTVQIGTQCWFNENLDIGTMIDSNANQTNNGTIEKYCYRGDPENCITYGGLYQWDEAMQFNKVEGGQGICPTGWHIPTNAEYQTLGNSVANYGSALKALGQGIGDSAGTNTSGFSALLTGYRGINSYFINFGYFTAFWSSSENDTTNAYNLSLDYYGNSIGFNDTKKNYGFSIRCVKD